MHIIRPIFESDLDDLCELASVVKGLTTLPNDREILENKIIDSLKAFNPHVRKPSGESYLFVLEDLEKDQVIGTSGIISKTGGFEPFYTYAIKQEIHESENPSVHREIPTLHLVENHNGPSELCGLFLHPEYRKHGLGRLLSLSRFLFIQAFKERFDENMISELRGVINEDGKSPFWECVGRHFFTIDFYTADFLSGTGNKQFIEDLMPEYPIYIPLLPDSVQSVIGNVHKNTVPARKLLEQEGFTYQNEVDIFDAGPTVSAKIDDIRTVKGAKTAKVYSVAYKKDSEKPTHLISNASLDFRCGLGNVDIDDKGQVTLSETVAKALKVSMGDTISYVEV